MRRARATPAALALGTALAAVLTGCGTGTDNGDDGGGARAVRAAVTDVQRMDSFRTSFALRLETGKREVRLEGESHNRREPRRASLMTFDTIEVGDQPKRTDLEIIRVADTAYLKAKHLDTPRLQPWLKVPDEDRSRAAARASDQMSWRHVLVDPFAITAIARAADQVTTAGEETIHGTPTTRYTASCAEAGCRALPGPRDALDRAFPGAGPVDLEIWLDEEGGLRQIRLHTMLDGKFSGDVYSTLELRDQPRPVPVEAPSKDVVTTA